jgi:hypothetical protein
MAINFSLRTAFVEFHRFWYVVFSFSLTSRKLLFINFLFITHLFTRAYIVWVISPSCPRPYPQPPSAFPSRLNLFCTFLQFHCRVEISNNTKDRAFLLLEIRTIIQRDS